MMLSIWDALDGLDSGSLETLSFLLLSFERKHPLGQTLC